MLPGRQDRGARSSTRLPHTFRTCRSQRSRWRHAGPSPRSPNHRNRWCAATRNRWFGRMALPAEFGSPRAPSSNAWPGSFNLGNDQFRVEITKSNAMRALRERLQRPSSCADVEQWQGLHVHPVWMKTKHLLRCINKGKQAAVHQQHTLWTPGRARGVELGRGIVRAGDASGIARGTLGEPIFVRLEPSRWRRRSRTSWFPREAR